MTHVRVLIGTANIPLTVWLRHDSTTVDLEKIIYEKEYRLNPHIHQLRFIYCGKLLALGQKINLKDGEFVHCAVSERRREYEGFESSAIRSDAISIAMGDEQSTMASVVSNHEEGALSDWTYGFVAGALLGVIVIVIGSDATLGTSSRWRNGVLCGAFLNIIFGIYVMITQP